LRALAAITLVMLLLIPLLAVSAAKAERTRSAFKARNDALALLELKGLDLAFKHAIESALRDSRGETRKEGVLAAASKLRGIELFFEEDERVEVWAGSALKSELDALPARMLEEKTALKCSACWDLDAVGLGWDDEPLPLHAALIDYDYFASVSRNGASLFKTPPPLLPEAGFGLSVYSNGKAAVFFVKEGFK